MFLIKTHFESDKSSVFCFKHFQPAEITPKLESSVSTDFRAIPLASAMREDLQGLIPLAEKVIDQTTRSVIHDQQVPAEEKSVFDL